MAVHSYPVSPQCVRVWRGYKSAAAGYEQFAQFLGSVFVPACARLQPPVGLRAYLPSMVPQANKPPAVPDQTALMFWATPTAHDEAPKALAVRVYSSLHGNVYDMSRSKPLPQTTTAFDPEVSVLKPEQPYFLLHQPADWMLGYVHHMVGARPENVPSPNFVALITSWAKQFVLYPPGELDGALLCCGNDYVAAWIHSASKKGIRSVLDTLAALTTPILRDDARRVQLRAGLWDDWPGLDLTKDPCLNVQLRRLPEAAPHRQGSE